MSVIINAARWIASWSALKELWVLKTFCYDSEKCSQSFLIWIYCKFLPSGTSFIMWVNIYNSAIKSAICVLIFNEWCAHMRICIVNITLYIGPRINVLSGVICWLCNICIFDLLNLNNYCVLSTTEQRMCTKMDNNECKMFLMVDYLVVMIMINPMCQKLFFIPGTVVIIVRMWAKDLLQNLL